MTCLQIFYRYLSPHVILNPYNESFYCLSRLNCEGLQGFSRVGRMFLFRQIPIILGLMIIPDASCTVDLQSGQLYDRRQEGQD